jgi:hypothetical protein
VLQAAHACGVVSALRGAVFEVSAAPPPKPEHGTVESVGKTDFVHYPKESIRAKCNQHRVKGTLVNYKSAEKYTGNDELELLVLFPAGYAWEIHYDVSVH